MKRRWHEPLPPAAANLLGFARMLRSSGFTVAPEQAISFMEGVALLGPRSMDDIREAALAHCSLRLRTAAASSKSLFRAYFWGDVVSAVAQGETDEATRVKEDGGAREVQLTART